MRSVAGLLPVLALALVLAVAPVLSCADEGDTVRDDSVETSTVQLPTPSVVGQMSLEEAIQSRRSVRDYSDEPLTLQEVGQLCWAAQGITSPQGARAAPSAGGTYPLEVYLAAGNVSGLAPGVYRYRAFKHDLTLVAAGDVRARLADACLSQAWVEQAAADVIIAAVYERTTARYGERGVRYVHLEVGHAAQNLCLQATALGLGAVTVGAFDDAGVRTVIGLPEEETPLYVVPIGRRK